MSADLAKIESALAAIPSDDRETWLQVGMAINSEIGDAGFSLWDSWSRSADSYSESAARSTWKSFSPGGGVTISTLFHVAQQNGWNGKGYPSLTDEEKARHRANMEAQNQQREAEQNRIHAEARQKAESIWNQSQPADPAHRYLVTKQVKPYGLSQYKEALVLPVRGTDGVLHGLQFISPDGEKKFLAGTAKKGSYFSIGGKPESVLYLAEGYATAATIHEATGHPVAVCFDAGNIKQVAKQLHSKMPGVNIVVCGDNDPSGTGQQAAEDAAQAINGSVSMPTQPGDFNDLAKASDLDEVRRQIEQSGQVLLLSAADIMPQAIRWIWPGWLAAGKLHILAGAPGTGKSTLAFALAASISTAGRWPDGTPADKGEVAIWSGEDDPADTIIPRLIACGAHLDNIKIVGGIAGEDPRPFDPSTDMAALHHALKARNIRLLIVDPVVSAVAGDSHKNTEVRRALQPLVDLAASTGCAVLGISHFTKSSAGKDPIDRVTGSLAFGALARVVMAAAKLPEDEHSGARLLARAKSNIGPDSGGVLYDMDQVEIPGHPGITNTRILWGALIEGTARDLLAQAEQNDGEEKTATDEAREWLADYLAAGSKPAKEIQTEAKRIGISEKALRRAKDKLKVTAQKQNFAGGWEWRLPEDAPRCPEDSPTTALWVSYS